MVIVFGGSFNPPTIAHEKIAHEVIRRFNPEKFIFVPVGNSYNKENLALFKHRVNMLALFTKNSDKMVVSDIEGTKSYFGTLHMLDELSKYYQNIVFLMGSDQLEELDKWIRVDELIKKYHFIVIKRQEIKEVPIVVNNLSHFTFVDLDYDMSSSLVRDDIEKNKRYLTKEVYDYIKDHHLYQ